MDGLYLEKDIKNNNLGVCKTCKSPCLSCIDSPEICTACVVGYHTCGRKCVASKML